MALTQLAKRLMGICSKALGLSVQKQKLTDLFMDSLKPGPFTERFVVVVEVEGRKSPNTTGERHRGVPVNFLFDLSLAMMPGFTEDHLRRTSAVAVHLQRHQLACEAVATKRKLMNTSPTDLEKPVQKVREQLVKEHGTADQIEDPVLTDCIWVNTEGSERVITVEQLGEIEKRIEQRKKQFEEAAATDQLSKLVTETVSVRGRTEIDYVRAAAYRIEADDPALEHVDTLKETKAHKLARQAEEEAAA